MIGNKRVNQATTISVALSMGILTLGMAIAPRATRAQAEIQQSPILGNPGNSWWVSEAFNPPDRGAPPRTTEGGTRGCGNYQPGQKPLAALTPANAMPLTVAEHPTWYWYVPESVGQNLEFKLLDENDREVLYSTTLQAPMQGGIISHRLPAEANVSLATGKTYHWYLVAVCDPRDRTGDIAIDGWIERVEPTARVQQQLKDAGDADRAAIYARSGIWHDALDLFAELRRENPQDPLVSRQWEQLLDSVELGEFAPEPLVNSTQVSSQE